MRRLFSTLIDYHGNQDKCIIKKRFNTIILTRLQTFSLMSNVSETLAGCIRICELSGLTFREIIGDSFNYPYILRGVYRSKRKQTFLYIIKISRISSKSKGYNVFG